MEREQLMKKATNGKREIEETGEEGLDPSGQRRDGVKPILASRMSL